MTTSDDAHRTGRAASVPRFMKAVYVYEVPVRLWHWINALSITVLAVTGYFIGSPLPSMPGEASAHFLMGYIRFLHFAAAYVFAIGFALYSEGAGRGSWQDALFGWVIPLFGQSQDVHTWHHLGMWLIVLFVMVHIYAAVREDIMSRQTIISTMISGVRSFKDAEEASDDPPAHRPGGVS
jgi:Ni,Fe-hydrogenase I cytochrome b subunit